MAAAPDVFTVTDVETATVLSMDTATATGMAATSEADMDSYLDTHTATAPDGVLSEHDHSDQF